MTAKTHVTGLKLLQEQFGAKIRIPVTLDSGLNMHSLLDTSKHNTSKSEKAWTGFNERNACFWKRRVNGWNLLIYKLKRTQKVGNLQLGCSNSFSVKKAFCKQVAHHPLQMAQQKVVFTVSALVDVKSKQRVMEAVADIHGVDTIAADFKEQKLTITGEMDIIAIAKRLKKFGKFEVASVETGEEQKEQNEGKK
ncbi:uncharacterized protein LOC135639142 [Musa acuminata AAA Group]|uniref:uncharacterized protein LOC135639142 n=2 Tax=Musa acuminata AAA Group TaxID=214697 RepID=UPI0031D25BDF